MAMISKIRNRSGLLITVIGVAMGLFVLSDLLGTGSSVFTQQNNDVASIGGDPISYAEFEAMVQQETNGQNLNSEQLSTVRDRVWARIIQDRVLYSEMDRLGLKVSPDELFYEIKNNNQNRILNQYFTNPQTGQLFDQLRDPLTGQLSSQLVLNYVNQLIQSGQESQWSPVEGALRSQRMSSKYNALIQKGLYISHPEAKYLEEENNKKVSFSYLAVNYTSIADDEIEFSEDDLKNYYDAHKSEPQFQQDETTRGIEYVTFNVIPTENDRNVIREELSEIAGEFQTADDDTLFANQNADTPLNFRYYKSGELPISFDSAAFEVENQNDTVFGPYEEGDAFKLAKVLGTKISPDSVKARHILIEMGGQNPNTDSATVHAQVDSLIDAINNGADFAEIAKELSIDRVSAADGGELGWFAEYQMVPEFNEACFNADAGDLIKVTTQYGLHIIEVQETTEKIKKVLVGIIDRAIRPSNSTFEDIFEIANKFSLENKNAEDFRQNGQIYNLQQAGFVKEGDKFLGQLENPREVIRWTYEAGVGEISQAFELGDQFIVAMLTNIKEAGTLSLDASRDIVETEVIKEKKAEKILENANGATDLDSYASSLNTEVKSNEGLPFNSFSIPGIGPEPEVLGILFNLSEGQTSEPVIGNRGVYVVRVDQTDASDFSGNLAQVRINRNSDLSGRVDVEVFNALRDASDVVDNRNKFY